MDELVHSNEAAFLSWLVICFNQKIGISTLNARLAIFDGSASAIQFCVTISHYHTELILVILYESDKF